MAQRVKAARLNLPISSVGGRALFVLVALLIVSGVRILLDPYVLDGIPYVLYLAAVAASTRWAGWQAGLGATLLGFLLGTLLFARPFASDYWHHAASALVFIAVALVVTASLAAEFEARNKIHQRDLQLFEEQAERLRLEKELSDSRRLEAIGRLAGGVAHDFNNLLTVVLGSSTLLREETEQREGLIESIEVAARRGTALTKQLLGFARRQMLVVEPVALNDVLREGMILLQRLLPEDVRLVTELQDDLWLLEGDNTQLQQVLLNLTTNARDALPKGGTIWIKSANVTLDERFAAEHPEVTPGEYVRLTVADDGVGMTDELRRRVFEPFFTTKDPGSGTGLGLAVTYGIVKQLNGHISVSTRMPGGTSFDVFFPRIAARLADKVAPERGAAEPGPILTVLLVDDDELVRRVTERILHLLGHHVLVAENCADALEISKSLVGNIDVLLTDVVMPWMNGRELAERLAAERPNLAVLYMSGYSENVVLNRGVVKPGVELLVKPFSVEQLATSLRNVTRKRAAAS